MKVLFIGEVSGGEGTFVKNLINNPPQGVEYSYIFSNGESNAKGVKIYKKYEKVLNLLKTGVIGAGMGIKIVEIEEDYDLIHLHGLATKLIMRKNIPIVFSASGNMWQGFLDFYKWNKFKFYKGYLGSKMLYRFFGITDRIHNNKLINKLVTWSEFVKNSYIRFGVPEEKIEVIYPGFPDPDYIVNQKTDTVNFLFIAGRNKFRRKGGYLVLKAFKQLLEEYNDINLFLVGEKPKSPLNIKGIKYFGYVDLKTLYNSIYPRTNVLVLPTYADGFPTVCAEVQGYGIPVITTNIWANPEIVLNNKTGFLILRGDLKSLIEYMKILIENEDLRVKMGKAAKENFKNKFSINVMTRKYSILYHTLASR